MDFKALKLSNGDKYVITNELKLKDKEFYLLLKIDGESDFEVAEKKDGELIFVEDIVLKTKVVAAMGKAFEKNNQKIINIIKTPDFLVFFC